MSDNGDLGVDVWRLKVYGQHDFPVAAEQYGNANHRVASAADGLKAAFIRPVAFGGGHSPIYDQWMSLHDEFQTLLGDISNNLHLAGEALVLCANEYAKADHGVKAKLDEMEREHGKDPDKVPVDGKKVPKPIYPPNV